jgi:hypothetical protein
MQPHVVAHLIAHQRLLYYFSLNHAPELRIMPASTTKANLPRGGDAKPKDLFQEDSPRRRQPGCRRESVLSVLTKASPQEAWPQQPRRQRLLVLLVDEDLISLAESGDSEAFATLYDRHSRAAYSLAY